MPNITEERMFHYAEEGYLYGAEFKNGAVANDATVFIQIEATTKPVTFVFGANVEALAWVNSFIGTELASPTEIAEYNYKPSETTPATAVVRVSATATTLGTQRGDNQTGSGSGGTGVGGSQSSRPTTLQPGEKLTLRLTNKGGANKSISVGVYWTEVMG